MKPGLIVLKDRYMICKADRNAEFSDWMDSDDFLSFTKTKEEISVICRQKAHEQPGILNRVTDKKIIKVNGPLDFSETGIIAGISGALADNGIPVFTISTYNTDYILISVNDTEIAVGALRDSGYKVIFE
jgi:hypothetical protein